MAIQSFKSRAVEGFFADRTLTRPVGWAFRWTPNGPADVDIVDYH